MRNVTFAATIVLTFLSGIVLSQLWSLEPMSVQPIPAGTGPEFEAAAAHFYDTINLYLEGGSDADVRRLLHTDFVTHQTGSAWAGSSEDFLQRLDSIRRFHPGIQLQAEPVALGDNTVSVALTTSNQHTRRLADFGITPLDVVGQLDLVKVDRGLIAEHWSTAPVAGQLHAYPDLSFDLPFASYRLVTRVQQITLGSSTEAMVSFTRHMLFIVTAGKAVLVVTKPAALPAMHWQERVTGPITASPVESASTIYLHPMEAVFLPAGTTFQLWESAVENTHLIALEFGSPASERASSTAPLLASLGETLWSGVTLEGVGKRLTISFGHVSMLPKTALSRQGVTGVELAWMAQGTLEIASAGGDAKVRKASGTRSQVVDSSSMLTAGDASAAGPGTQTRYLNSADEPATVWFISVGPASAEEHSDDSSADSPKPTGVPTQAPIRFHS